MVGQSVEKPSRSESGEKLRRTQNLMNNHVVDSLVRDYEYLIETFELPDPNDRHVLAAAVHCGATIIATFNLDDFPKKQLSPYGIEAIAPDDLIARQISISPESVLSTAREQREEMKNPAKTVEQYLDTLEKQRLPKTVVFLREHRDEI